MDEQPRLVQRQPNAEDVVRPGVGQRQKSSPIWTHFEEFFPSTAIGLNVRCIVAKKVPSLASAPERMVFCYKCFKYVRSSKAQGIMGRGIGNLLEHSELDLLESDHSPRPFFNIWALDPIVTHLKMSFDPMSSIPKMCTHPIVTHPNMCPYLAIPSIPS